MEIRTIEIAANTLFILFILFLIIIAVKKPKEFFFKFPLQILKVVVGWHWVEGLFSGSKGDNDFNYSCERKIPIDFKTAEKYILVFGAEEEEIKRSISEGIASLDGPTLSGEVYKQAGNFILIVFPENLDFYTYHYLLQWLHHEKLSHAGYVRSAEINYVVYQDPNSLNNLIGETEGGDRISVSLYKNYRRSQYLVVNSKIKPDKQRSFGMISDLVKNNTEYTDQIIS